MGREGGEGGGGRRDQEHPPPARCHDHSVSLPQNDLAKRYKIKLDNKKLSTNMVKYLIKLDLNLQIRLL